MKIKNLVIAAFALCTGFVATVPAQEKSAARTADAAMLKWFTGCWEFSVPEKKMTIAEMWMRPEGGMLVGVSRTVVEGKAVGYEFIRVAGSENGMAYFAKPSSASAETPFTLRSITEREVVFENPDNEFPQRIIYRKGSSAATLFARIEGGVNGSEQSMDFNYKRVKCE